MVLTDRGIREEIFKGNVVIGGFKLENLNPNSYDMTLDNKCKVYHPAAYANMPDVMRRHNPEFAQFHMDWVSTLDPKAANPVFEFEIPESGFVLKPNHLYLYSCREILGVKNDICATVMGKSSLGRLGLDIHVCAGFVDAGFVGSLVLEMRTIYPLRVYPGMKICQVKFERTEGIPDEQYDAKAGSKYQGQRGVVESKYHKNYDDTIQKEQG